MRTHRIDAHQHFWRLDRGDYGWLTPALGPIHRDFTPDNIHVGVDGQVKVIDFGIAKAEHLGSGTEPGTLKGKFFYMSPEMIGGRPVDHRADLYAAGMILYMLLAGRDPFHRHREVFDVLTAQVNEPPETGLPA